MGVVTAWEELRRNPDARMVDVRTKAEWSFVGIPDLAKAGKEVDLVEWQSFPTMEQNGAFVEEVSARIADKSSPVYLLCRSGARSRSAAMALTAAGYETCFNVRGGFEGPHDGEKHRGTTEGWKAQGLPWVQG
ncbi:MAG: rhodanese-like domain-containing protein [Alphaproteobacteria bacterium]